MLHNDDHIALKISPSAGTERARPMLHQHAGEIQPFGKIAKLPIALDETVCVAGVELFKSDEATAPRPPNDCGELVLVNQSRVKY